jgi:hypothetical protein
MPRHAPHHLVGEYCLAWECFRIVGTSGAWLQPAPISSLVAPSSTIYKHSRERSAVRDANCELRLWRKRPDHAWMREVIALVR